MAGALIREAEESAIGRQQHRRMVVVHGEWLGPHHPVAPGSAHGYFPDLGAIGELVVVALAQRSGMDSHASEPTGPAEHVDCTVWWVPVDPSEIVAFREAFANQGPGPARAYGSPFRADDFQVYCRVNRRCAATLCAAAGDDACVLIEDHHLALVPQMARIGLPTSTIVVRWSLPWPRHEMFDCRPWGLHIVEGLLGADCVLLRTAADRDNFLTTVRCCVDATVDRCSGEIVYGDRRLFARVDPEPVFEKGIARTPRSVPVSLVKRRDRRRIDR